MLYEVITGGADWANRLSGYIGNITLNDIVFVDNLNGLVCGNGGKIFVTSDGGLSWAESVSGTALSINGLNITGNNDVFACGLSGILLKSSNNGISWETKNSGTNQALYAVCFAGTNNGWAVGSSGTVINSVNAGETSYNFV